MSIWLLLDGKANFGAELLAIKSIVLKALEVDKHVFRHFPKVQFFHGGFIFFAVGTTPHVVANQAFGTSEQLKAIPKVDDLGLSSPPAGNRGKFIFFRRLKLRRKEKMIRKIQQKSGQTCTVQDDSPYWIPCRTCERSPRSN
jgi:hypothetical protein